MDIDACCSGLAEGDGIELAILQHLEVNLLHLGRHPINGHGDRRFAIVVEEAGEWTVFVARGPGTERQSRRAAWAEWREIEAGAG